jgi:hypothetical protein
MSTYPQACAKCGISIFVPHESRCGDEECPIERAKAAKKRALSENWALQAVLDSPEFTTRVKLQRISAELEKIRAERDLFLAELLAFVKEHMEKTK